MFYISMVDLHFRPRVRGWGSFSYLVSSTLLIGYCDIHSEWKILSMNETKQYEICLRLKDWVQVVFHTFLQNFRMVLMKVALNFVHFAWHGHKWVKWREYLMNFKVSLAKFRKNLWSFTKLIKIYILHKILQNFMKFYDININFVPSHWIL